MVQEWIEDTLTMANEHSEMIQAGINGVVK